MISLYRLTYTATDQRDKVFNLYSIVAVYEETESIWTVRLQSNFVFHVSPTIAKDIIEKWEQLA